MVDFVESSALLAHALGSDPTSALVPSQSLHQATIVLAKQLLDPLATSLLRNAGEKSGRTSRKRKRGLGKSAEQPFKLRQLSTQDLRTPQIWDQARQIIHAGGTEVHKRLADLKSVPGNDHGDFSGENGSVGNQDMLGADHESVTGSSDTSDEEDDAMLEDLMDDELDAENRSVKSGEPMEKEKPKAVVSSKLGVFKKDVHGLNDGFFSIDDFNRETNFLERQDARDEGNGSENPEGVDIEIDFDADPLEPQQSHNFSGNGENSIRHDAMSDADGSTGMAENVTSSGDEEESMDGSLAEELQGLPDYDMMVENTNDIMYGDFFGAARDSVRTSARNRNRVDRERDEQDDKERPDDVQRTMDAVHRDLFDDGDDNEDLSASETEGFQNKTRSSHSAGKQSTYEKQKAQLRKEIRRLEAANVAEKPWMLAGEARAAVRPVNSLLEQDLDFERVGKPVPVITAEISEDIEHMIKRRIITGEFDEVKRRRPDTVSSDSNFRRGAFELSDAKPQQGLAEMYEEDYRAKVDPGTYISQTDEATKKEHAEILQLWKTLSMQLDGLSNYHYRPKPAAPAITIVSNLPTITMEDARPSGIGGEMGSTSMLAPQELNGAQQVRSNGSEIMTKGGTVLSREELTREQKLRRRRREKERLRKSGAQGGEKDKFSKKSLEKEKIVGDLKKGNVQVIGKRGELIGMDGKRPKIAAVQGNAASYKL